MIRMQDQHVVIVINNALAVMVELSNNMNEGFRGDRRLKPSSSKIGCLDNLLVFYLKDKDLTRSANGMWD